MKKTLLIAAGIMLSGVVLAVGIIVYLRSNTASGTPVSANGKPIALTTSESNGASSATVPIDSTTPTPSKTSSPSSELRVVDPKSANTSGSSEAANIPGPDTFSQYEQYSDKTEALFGELRLGDGAVVEMNKQVTVHYKGWLTNGKEFDESYARGTPFTFTVGAHRVISGWEQAILGMKVGGKRRFIVPASVGYGSTGQGTSIPPNSLLVFDVELLAVQ